MGVGTGIAVVWGPEFQAAPDINLTTVSEGWASNKRLVFKASYGGITQIQELASNSHIPLHATSHGFDFASRQI